MIAHSVVRLPAPEITLDDVLAGIGMGDKSPAGSIMRELVGDIVAEALTNRIKPLAVLDSAPISLLSQSITIADNSTHIECDVSSFTGATHILMSMMTIGNDCETAMADMLDSGDPFSAMVYDAVGNMAILETIKRLKDLLFNSLSECLWVGNLVEPGTDQISLEVQRACFSLLNASEIGIELTDSLLMIPVKSFSFILPYRV